MENAASNQHTLTRDLTSAGVSNIFNPSERGTPRAGSQYPDPDVFPPILEIELPVMNTPPLVLRPHPSATPAARSLSPAPTPQPATAPPTTPMPPPSPLQVSTNLPIQPNPITTYKHAYLSLYATPHFLLYPANPSQIITPTSTIPFHPPQPHRPPTLLPEHPIFAYWGRDLSSPTLLLPKLNNGQNLFVRQTAGDMSDQGFGPGVIVHDDVRENVAEAERRTLELLVRWDAGRYG